jgi:hypothetical protein
MISVRLIALAQQEFRTPVQQDAGIRELDAAMMAGEQRGAELVLQKLDLAADRRLRDAQLGRRAGEIPVLRNRHEVAQLGEIHRHLPSAIGITERHDWAQIIQLDLCQRSFTMAATARDAPYNEWEGAPGDH